MIDQAAGYESNELIHKIRSEYGTRTTSKGVADTRTPLQDELRSSESEGGQPSRADIEGSPRDTGDVSQLDTDQRTPKRRDSREGRANSKVDQGDGGPNSHLNPISRAFQQHKTDDGGLNEEKPSGLYTKPNVKEQRARQADAGSNPSSPSGENKKAGFFRWLRSDNRGKTAKEPKAKRTRPLTEKEQEELKPDLVEALRDGLPLLDQVILATNRAHAKPYIYASIDDEDIDKLANWWLKKARKSGEMAEAARQIIAYHDDVEILLMIIPTIPQTLAFYKDNGGFTLRGR